MDRSLLAQIRHVLAPLSNRIANAIARAVVQVVNDGTTMQSLQLGVLAGEDIDDAERLQEYGFSSVPRTGAEAVVLFPNGDRGRPLVVAVDDRRYRPTGLEPGEVVVYSDTGAQVKITEDGDIIASPGAGRHVLLGSASAADPVALKSDLDALKVYLDAHAHTGVTTGAGVSGPPAASPTPMGATKVRAE